MSNHFVKVGKATYTYVSKRKTYSVARLLLNDVIGQGKLVMDSGFPRYAI